MAESKRKSNRGAAKAAKAKAPAERGATGKAAPERLGGKDYDRELAKLHERLVDLQGWVQHAGLKVCILFEGRDTAGKGGTIKAITERVSPRVFRVVALPAPTEREKSQMYIQRYMRHLPAAGEIVIFDRSWYNRAGVERVMGFCTEDQAKRFLAIAPMVEKAMVESGILLIKYWLEVEHGRADAAPRAADEGRPQDLEAHADGRQVVQPLVRLLAGARRDVRRDRLVLGALVRRALGRQAPRAPQRDQPPAHAHPAREGEARQDQAAEAAEARRLPRVEPPDQATCPRATESRRGARAPPRRG